ncbi:uncharacterized protein LOC141629330 [Silene latifolia]|uniref:uncharacterized protein LOC141629330 n=1 Tax=Silene latifolia TaxID=37657 RepID=UPI003D77CFEA
MAGIKNPNKSPKLINVTKSKASIIHSNTKNKKHVDSNTASSSNNKGKSPVSVRPIRLTLSPLATEELDVILEEDQEEQEEEIITEREINYWSSAVFCYILGAKPPSSVVTGFVKRVWQSYGVDRISFLPNGIFLVRFKSKEKQLEVVRNGHLMFDSKPVIVKEWSPDVELIKHDVKLIPIWMKLYGLDIKFWGPGCLSKISGLVGKFLRCDEATSNRAFLGFARVLVEIKIGQEFPTELVFEDELGKTQRVRVVYDWLPLSCDKCKGLGHTSDLCRADGRKPQKTPIAKPVPKPVSPPISVVTPMAEPVVIMETPAIGQEMIDNGQSLPRRFISKLLRNDSGEPRLFTPRGITFMDALNLSMQKARTESRKKLGFQVDISENGHHPGGRVWILWDPNLYQVDVLNINEQCIHYKVYDKMQKVSFLFTLVYGFNKIQERESLLESLKGYSVSVASPWLVCGDFNSIISVDERIGGADVTWAEIAPMRSMMSDCNLHELKVTGSYYTWNNKHENDTKVYSRLDRVIVNDDWILSYPDSMARFCTKGLYDHCPCVINLTENHIRKKSAFKYFNMWSMAANFSEVVKEGWNCDIQSTPMFRVVKKLKGLKKKLKNLDREQFSDIENLTHVTELSLKHFQDQLSKDPLNPELCNAKREGAQDLVNLTKARNSFLAQKAKENWVKNGDENTAFFHASIKRRRAFNRVYHIKDNEGKLCTTPQGIKSAFEEYYIGLLGSSTEVTPIHKGVIRNGPDGYSSQFFKDSCAIVGKDICNAVRNMISSGKVLKEANNTTLTLIPKVNVPDSVTQFRPITCCNTVYKCMAKVLCSRLSCVLPDIIHPSQGAFVAGRDIVGNILICQDLIKLYNRKICSPKIMMKIDLQKAYDSIEWSFLHDMLVHLQFPQSSIDLIMQCVSSPSYSLALNGEVFGFFKGKRGLRQGDPLSPLLFTICLDYLSRLFGVLHRFPGFKFHPFCNKISLNHLCFADDLLLFSRGDLNSITLMMRAFSTFSLASSLHMNISKYSFYCNGICDSLVKDIEALTGMKRGSLPFKYLGVKVMPKILGVLDCQCLVDKVTERIQRLGAKQLSYAGRVVLISAVFSALHSYWARIFMIPKLVLKKIDTACRAFLWYVKHHLKHHMFDDEWRRNAQEYSVQLGYSWLAEDVADAPWYPWLRNKIMLPKHEFFIWLVAQNRLLTQDRLMKMNIIHDNCCFLCGAAEENIDHLFFLCPFSQHCKQQIAVWLGSPIPNQNVIPWWLGHRDRSLLRKQIVAACLAHVMYSIWQVRNRCRLEHVLTLPAVVIKQVKQLFIMQLRASCVGSSIRSVQDWIARLE